jgi:tRNA (guanosine-2'-O-)-methyltransferase
MLTKEEHLLLLHLAGYVTEHKKEFIDRVLDLRTRHITVVLEDIFQSQNASAVIRTCECLGVQDVHVTENHSTYKINRRVLKGADKWMSIFRYHEGEESIIECYQFLRRRGYTIIAADPGESWMPIDDLEVSQPVALVFGNELHGLSGLAMRHCDLAVRVPMYGFTGSMNISVSAALSVYTLIKKLREKGILIELSHPQKDELKLSWYRKIVRRSEIIEREFMRTIP